MKIYFVRHGETDANVAKQIQGQRINGPLNALGRQQAQERAQALVGMGFEMLFSSPLKRAHETADIINAKLNLPLLLRDELKERDFGTLTGRLFADMNAEMGVKWNQVTPLEDDEKFYHEYERETAEHFSERLKKFVEEVKGSYADKKVLVVAHGGIIRLAHYLFNETHVDHIANAAVEEFEV
jgi:broad specificity phosphatase PhoE